MISCRVLKLADEGGKGAGRQGVIASGSRQRKELLQTEVSIAENWQQVLDAKACFFQSSQSSIFIIRAIILGPLLLLWIIALTRILGLRSFSKLTAFDFLVTLATASLLANAASASSWDSFLQSSLAATSLLLAQRLLSVCRTKNDRFAKLIENSPVLLMHDGEFLEAELERQNVTKDDVNAKLREADVGDQDEVRAVILERTGELSVLTGPKSPQWLLKGIK